MLRDPIALRLFDQLANVHRIQFVDDILVTVEDLHRGVSRLRNRVMGRVFHALGLIEQWGSGVQRMTAACRELGLASPRFEEIALRFRVTISMERIGRPRLDDTDQLIMDALEASTGLLTSEIAGAIGLTPRATRTRLARLVVAGLVREAGTGPQDPGRRYYRAA